MSITHATFVHLLQTLCVYGLLVGAEFALIDEWIDHKENPRYRMNHYYDRMPKGRKRRYRR